MQKNKKTTHADLACDDWNNNIELENKILEGIREENYGLQNVTYSSFFVFIKNKNYNKMYVNLWQTYYSTRCTIYISDVMIKNWICVLWQLSIICAHIKVL